jgi:MoxR-like ATPase
VRRVEASLRIRLRGQESVIHHALVAFLSGGHLLLEGPPGVGKTSLARGLAESFEGAFSRVQMTSDLLPSEIVGVLRPNHDQSDFEFRKGPLFANIVLADELNRTSPKTQAALLEAMAENTVSVDGKTYALPDPFFVVATQNPLEFQGVYPLVESQLDRFMLQIKVGLPNAEHEILIYQAPFNSRTEGHEAVPLTDKVTLEEVRLIRKQLTSVHTDPGVIRYAYELVAATRQHPRVEGGVSVRGGLQFLNAARANAYLSGRDFLMPQDLSELAIPALAHRLRLDEGINDWEVKSRVIQEIVERTPKPK